MFILHQKQFNSHILLPLLFCGCGENDKIGVIFSTQHKAWDEKKIILEQIKNETRKSNFMVINVSPSSFKSIQKVGNATRNKLLRLHKG